MSYLHTTIELVTGFIALLILTKIVGRRTISQITPFDFISALVLGELLGNAIYDPDTTVTDVLYAVTLWGILLFIVEVLTQKSLWLRTIFDGAPAIVIRDGIIDRAELKKHKININELQTLLREKDIFSLREVEYAILESDGRLSVLKKSEYMTPTREDLDLPPQHITLPYALIRDGQLIEQNVKAIGYDRQWLEEQLSSVTMLKIEDIFYAEWIKHKGLFIAPMGERTPLEKEV